ncbi:MAG: M14 family metallopeptidase [Candidatus Paceibacterota bacterium]|jgi:hypothetical protein
MKKFITIVIVIVLIGFGIYYFTKSSPKAPVNQNTTDTTTDSTATTTQSQTSSASPIIGKSAEGRDILAYHFGTGNTEILFVAGSHGGYEWNTVLLAGQLMNYLQTNPSAIPANLKVTIIPVLNPDGLNKVVGTTSPNFTKANVSTSEATVISGRFNGDNVDINRNFDCDWQATGTWQNKTVSGGSEVFSEPEAQAIKNYVETNKPVAVVAFYSAAGGVYASNCHNGVSADTKTIMNKFADASGYSAYDTFDFYSTTGDMTNWLAKIGTPAINVLLTNHTDTEWTKNLAGVKALLNYYATK